MCIASDDKVDMSSRHRTLKVLVEKLLQHRQPAVNGIRIAADLHLQLSNEPIKTQSSPPTGCSQTDVCTQVKTLRRGHTVLKLPGHEALQNPLLSLKLL